MSADEKKQSYLYELTVEDKETVEVKKGDTIEVTLKLKRTDLQQPYLMYAMQDEIRYDSSFFEFVEDSEVLSPGVQTISISKNERHREFYMNYLSMGGGEEWNEEEIIGSFKLRVIGESGVTKITNQDYLVSFQDGSDSYPCKANELMVILSTDCIVQFRTNGGNEIEDQIVQYGEKIKLPDTPVREGFSFSGWYRDINLSEEWDFEKDTVEENMSLYAKWEVSEEKNDSMPDMWWLAAVLLIIMIVIFVVKKRMVDTSHTRPLE